MVLVVSWGMVELGDGVKTPAKYEKKSLFG